jgi:CRP/FNR family cyclic AMP-dependent transcriptional regulator
VFADLDESQVQAVLARARRRRFRRGEVLVREGDPGDAVHLIDRGHVAVRVATPLGDVATVRILVPGDLFGEMAVLSDQPRMATIVALGAVETLSLHRSVLGELRAAQTSIDRILLAAALDEVRRLSYALMEAYYVPVPKRMARTLGQLADTFGDTIPLTQDDLAGLCGTTRQTANEVLRDLAARAVIALHRGRLDIVNRVALDRAAG